MRTLRELADQRSKLTWQDNPRAYLEDLIQENWERGANSMLLSKVSFRHFVPTVAQSIVMEVTEKIRNSLPPDAPRIKGQHAKRRLFSFQHENPENSPVILLPEYLTSEK